MKHKQYEIILKSFDGDLFILDVLCRGCYVDDYGFVKPILATVSVRRDDGNYTTRICSINIGAPKISDLVKIRDLSVNFVSELSLNRTYTESEVS